MMRLRFSQTRDFGRHPVEGVTCSFYAQQTDNLLNQLVLAGLESASRILCDTPWVAHAYNQVFIWRSVAAEGIPKVSDFVAAERQINRLTEHYRPVLSLARALTLGFTPDDLFSGSSSVLQVLEFYLPLLFEKFLYRLLNGYAAKSGFGVHFRETDPAALVDGFGDNYRSVEPDIVMYLNDRPVAVIDAKYKPRYLRGRGQDILSRANRVTNADLYQLYFYQSRLQRAFGLRDPPQAAIVAPLMEDEGPFPCAERRTIIWRSTDSGSAGVTVLPLPLTPIIRKLQEGADEASALEMAPELVLAIASWTARSGNVATKLKAELPKVSSVGLVEPVVM